MLENVEVSQQAAKGQNISVLYLHSCVLLGLQQHSCCSSENSTVFMWLLAFQVEFLPHCPLAF